MKRALNNQLLSMAGKCALDIIREEADKTIENMDLDSMDTADLDKWFFDTINKQNSKDSYKRPLFDRILLYAAGIVLAIIMLGAVILTTFEPARAALIRFLIERFPEYSAYSINYEKDEQIGIMEPVYPTYIPDGFELDDSAASSDSSSKSWVNPNTKQFIYYLQTDGKSSTALDTEGASVQIIQLNGVDADVIEKSGGVTIQFFYKDTCYVVYTDISFAECLKIAESIPLK